METAFEGISRITTEDRIREYAEMVKEVAREDISGFSKHADDVNTSVEFGRKYAKVLVSDKYTSRRIHTFVDMTNGNIHKAATFNSPETSGKTKGVRGNIWSEDMGRSVINWHGAKYLKAKYLK